MNTGLWGPKTIKNVNGFDYERHIMTMIDPVTGWWEFAQLYGPPTAYISQEIFDNIWLSCYPRPEEIGFDNGSKFKKEFSNLCANTGLKKKKRNISNPQLNTILERVHQVLEEGLRVFNLDNKKIDLNVNDLFKDYLTAVVYVIHSVYHQTHGHSLVQLVCSHDMFLPINRKIDWEAIKSRKQERI